MKEKLGQKRKIFSNCANIILVVGIKVFVTNLSTNTTVSSYQIKISASYCDSVVLIKFFFYNYAVLQSINHGIDKFLWNKGLYTVQYSTNFFCTHYQYLHTRKISRRTLYL